MQTFKLNKKGFTILELILYIAIISSLLLGVSLFLNTMLLARVKNQTVAEVEQQGLQVMQIITQAIRNAENINSPATGASSASLSLDVLTAGDDPTVFDLSGGAIRIDEGTGPTVPLTNSRVVASGLSFRNLTRPNSPGVIRVQFTLTHINPAGRQEYDFAKTFYNSASLRW